MTIEIINSIINTLPEGKCKLKIHVNEIDFEVLLAETLKELKYEFIFTFLIVLKKNPTLIIYNFFNSEDRFFNREIFIYKDIK